MEEQNNANLTERTYMRLSTEEKAELAKKAAEKGIGESTYLRMIYLDSKKEG